MQALYVYLSTKSILKPSFELGDGLNARWHNRAGSVLSNDWLGSSHTGLVIYVSSCVSAYSCLCVSPFVYLYARSINKSGYDETVPHTLCAQTQSEQTTKTKI